jgi:hypothetical protein
MAGKNHEAGPDNRLTRQTTVLLGQAASGAQAASGGDQDGGNGFNHVEYHDWSGEDWGISRSGRQIESRGFYEIFCTAALAQKARFG